MALVPEPARDTAVKGVRPGSGAFIALVAGLMTMTAMTVDINLPAVPAIATALDSTLTAGQFTIVIFFLGFAVGQVFWGPVSDRFGRKPVLMVGMVIYMITTAGCVVSQSMEQLLLMRCLQGIGAGAGSILARAMVRDLFKGAEMARTMSLIQAAFITAPVVAPTLGALLLQLGSWRFIFVFLLGYGLLFTLLAAWLLPESLPQKNPHALQPARLVGAYAAMFGSAASAFYAAVVVLTFGPLNIYLTNAPAVFMGTYGLDATEFAWAFAAVALVIAAGNLTNARLVRHFELRRVIWFGLAISGVMGAFALALLALHLPNGWALVPVLGGFFFGFTLVSSNATALALQPHGAIAGTAASALGVAQTIVPAAIASLVAAIYDGTALPMLVGMLLCVLLATLVLRSSRRPMLVAGG
jgi:DHA1 family bicyclomycin/chloramphenicol resistance-like MFS transporter